MVKYKKMKKLHLNNRLFFTLFGVGICYVLAFFFPVLMNVAHGFLVLVILTFMVDYLFLFNQKNAIQAQRVLPEKLSNGDQNSIKIDIKNNYPFKVKTKIIDEIPFQFQKRDFLIERNINLLYKY